MDCQRQEFLGSDCISKKNNYVIWKIYGCVIANIHMDYIYLYIFWSLNLLVIFTYTGVIDEYIIYSIE